MTQEITKDLRDFYNQMKMINPSGTASFDKYFENDTIYDFTLYSWKYRGSSSSFPTFERRYFVCNIYFKNGQAILHAYKTITQIEEMRKQGIEVHVFSWISPVDITDYEMEYNCKLMMYDEPAFMGEVDE